MRRALLAAACTLALAGAGQAHAAAYTIIPLVAPGAAGPGGSTTPVAINDLGQVVGFASASSTGLVTNFIYAGGSYGSLNAPAASAFGNFKPADINNVGQVIGTSDAGNTLDTNGVFTALPNTITGNLLPFYGIGNPLHFYGINDAGKIVGSFFNLQLSSYSPVFGGLLYANGTFTDLGTEVGPTKINDAGQFIANDGYNSSHSSASAALDSLPGSGVASIQIAPPGSFAGSVFASGLSNAGAVVGSYNDAVQAYYNGYPVSLYYSGAQHGFIYGNGAYTTFDIAGATATALTGINDAGDLIGTYTDAQGNTDAFLALPVTTVPEPASLALLATGLVGLTLAARRRA